MGLQMNLSKENNILYQDFANAYWKIHNIGYTQETGWADLSAYPSRESSQEAGKMLQKPTLQVGGPIYPTYNPELYRWHLEFQLAEVFPNGIPIDINSQKTAIYIYAKKYSNLPFADVFEPENLSNQ